MAAGVLSPSRFVPPSEGNQLRAAPIWAARPFRHSCEKLPPQQTSAHKNRGNPKTLQSPRHRDSLKDSLIHCPETQNSLSSLCANHRIQRLGFLGLDNSTFSQNSPPPPPPPPPSSFSPSSSSSPSLLSSLFPPPPPPPSSFSSSLSYPLFLPYTPPFLPDSSPQALLSPLPCLLLGETSLPLNKAGNMTLRA